MSADGIRRAVDAMSEAARNLNFQPDDDFDLLLRAIAMLAREMSETAKEIKATQQLDKDVVDAVERATLGIAYRVRTNIDWQTSVIMSIWFVISTLAGASAMMLGLWLGGMLR